MSLKWGNRAISAAELWPKKTIFNIAAVHHLECKNILGHVTAIYFQMCYCVRNFIEIG